MQQEIECLISAGPTREWVDPVRFISNPSSGKMGYALARAAEKRGMKVTLVSGPVSLPPPEKVRTILVETAVQMNEAMHANFNKANLTIMTAAVCDHRPKAPLAQKHKKHGPYSLELIPNEDILGSLGKLKTSKQMLVGFAAETQNHLENAKAKIIQKNLDWIVLNDVSNKDQGFQSDFNEVTIISKDETQVVCKRGEKTVVANEIINLIWP